MPAPNKQILAIVVSFNVDIYLIGYCIVSKLFFLPIFDAIQLSLYWVVLKFIQISVKYCILKHKTVHIVCESVGEIPT